MVTLPQPGDPVEEPVEKEQPSFFIVAIKWGLLLSLTILGVGYTLDYFF